ncbi:alpha/beta fold hydrolase [Sneathiella glossodoripedis]|uniref:alpha/beta fold hydrolase n=1 Tax=Sneathiella glossodoripedis TaxID=418853 RepID=UPI00046F182B|nr:alpha/beta hydrolase [Sneathiella glossodoripedis]
MTNKTPLILVPGLLCTKDLWRDQIQALGDMAEITVARHDQHETVEEIATSILEQAPDEFSLAGLSMGGYIALEIVLRAPERVQRLALMDTRADADSPKDKKRRLDFIRLVERGSTFKGVTESLLPMLIHPDRFQDTDLTSRIYKMAQDIGRDGFIRQETAILNRKDRNAELSSISCPTLVLSGNEDALIPAPVQQKMAEKIPDSEFHIIDNCGHLPTMERPMETNKIMREWLSW